jgi:predicted phosphodiesterase
MTRSPLFFVLLAISGLLPSCATSVRLPETAWFVDAEFAPGNEAEESGDFEIQQSSIPERVVKRALRRAAKGRHKLVLDATRIENTPSHYRVRLEDDRNRYVVEVRQDGKIVRTVEESLPKVETTFEKNASLDRLRVKLVGRDKVRFAVFGDCRSNSRVFEAVLRSLALKKPDFAIVVGDLVSRGTPEQFAEYYAPPIRRHCDFPVLPVPGNHDIRDKGEAYEELFGADSRCYHFAFAGCVFVVLDNSVSDRETIPVFLGHIHAYSTAVFDGVEYTVTGGGGASLHDRFGDAGRIHHYMLVDVDQAGFRITGIRLLPVAAKK